MWHAPETRENQMRSLVAEPEGTGLSEDLSVRVCVCMCERVHALK
jgi:hypothetical protein